jgi:hypothetical protein
VSPTVAWQLSWGVGAFFCVLAGVWFLVLTVPEEGRPFAWVFALAFCVLCVAAAANLRRLLWDAFVGPGGPGRISYLSVLLETGLWAFISAGLVGASARAGAARAARGWAVSFVAFSVVSAYCFWRVL